MLSHEAKIDMVVESKLDKPGFKRRGIIKGWHSDRYGFYADVRWETGINTQDRPETLTEIR